jgi:two-component system, OmpR family, phosphate regulon sensor histidine kinase PhoR
VTTLAAWLGCGAALLAGGAAVLGWRHHAQARRREAAAAKAQRVLLEADLHDAAQALAAAPCGLAVLDAGGNVRSMNRCARELLAIETEPVGRRLGDLVPWPQFVAVVEDARRAAAARHAELEGEQAEGVRAISVAVGVEPLRGGGCVVTLDDLSRVRRLESLRRDFVANVSHELKTPLAAIQGLVETIQGDPEMPVATRERFLERIHIQSERLSSLVRDLLALSRLDEEQGLVRDVEPCDLAAMVQAVVHELGPLAERRGLVLDAQLPGAGCFVAADTEALRQVVTNLVDNAVKYTAKGSVRAVVAANGTYARFEVIDTGIGLGPADRDRIFERFYRVDRARSRDDGGTGLGLSIVKNTVLALGGRLGVDSELGKGSTFWVELPLAEGGAG